MKKILEILVCIIHPVAVVLIWADLVRRRDIVRSTKIVWAIFVILPLIPFFYVMFSGELWKG
jgi:hypothetical protein